MILTGLIENRDHRSKEIQQILAAGLIQRAAGSGTIYTDDTDRARLMHQRQLGRSHEPEVFSELSCLRRQTFPIVKLGILLLNIDSGNQVVFIGEGEDIFAD